MKLAASLTTAFVLALAAQGHAQPECNGNCELDTLKVFEANQTIKLPIAPFQAVKGQFKSFIFPTTEDEGNFIIRLFFKGPLGDGKQRELVAETPATLTEDIPLLDIVAEENGMWQYEVENIGGPARVEFFSDYTVWNSCEGYCGDTLGNPASSIFADRDTITPSGCACTTDCLAIQNIGGDPTPSQEFDCCDDYLDVCPLLGLQNPLVPLSDKTAIRSKYADVLARIAGDEATVNAAASSASCESGSAAGGDESMSAGAAAGLGAVGAIAAVAVGAGLVALTQKNKAKATRDLTHMEEAQSQM